VVGRVEAIERSDAGPQGERPFLPATINCLRNAVEEALSFGHNYVGTEHLLLALFRAPDDPAAAILHELGANENDLRRRVQEKIASLKL